jgi:hypothetical protein
MNALRKREKAEKIAICEELMARCPESVKAAGDWKRWISEHSKAKKHIVTVTWITRALNQGWLPNVNPQIPLSSGLTKNGGRRNRAFV